MEMQKVSSSAIASVGYDEATQIMAVKFNSGQMYYYSGVSQSEYDGLMTAESPGKYFRTMNLTKM
jgi:hypothetical protein